MVKELKEKRIHDLYAIFDKQCRDTTLDMILRRTGSVEDGNFIDACKYVEQQRTLPFNVSQAIINHARDKRNISHRQLKQTDFTDCDTMTESSQRYFKCVGMALSMANYKGFNYMDFAVALGESWKRTSNEAERMNCLDVYARTLKEIKQ